MKMTTNQQGLQTMWLAGFLAPKGSTDWCSSCGWESRCGQCRAWQD